MALSMPLGFSQQSDAPAASNETEACACTCAACAAKHGAKAKEASAPAPNLPDAPMDIEAEVARILATDLGAVDSLLELEADAGVGVGVTAVGVAEVVDVEEDSTEATSEERGYMGISLGGNEEGGGAMVGTVNAGSPAEKAGLKPGDLIVAAEGMPLDSNEDLIAAVIDLKVGQTATLEIERGDEELELDVVLAPREEPMRVRLLTDVTNGSEEGALRELGYGGGDSEDAEAIIAGLDEMVRLSLENGGDGEVDVTLPSGSPVLLRVVDSEDGNTFVFKGDEAPELRRRITFLEAGVEAIEEVEEQARREPVQLRWSTDSGKRHSDSEALPEGYVEVLTRRERRPSDNDGLRRRMRELEQEVAELSKVVAELRAELNRRNPR